MQGLGVTFTAQQAPFISQGSNILNSFLNQPTEQGKNVRKRSCINRIRNDGKDILNINAHFYSITKSIKVTENRHKILSS